MWQGWPPLLMLLRAVGILVRLANLEKLLADRKYSEVLFRNPMIIVEEWNWHRYACMDME